MNPRVVPAIVSVVFLAVAAGLAQDAATTEAADLAKQKEQHRKFAEASVQARQEEPIAKAFETATKAYQRADLMLLQRIKQLDPTIAEYVDARIRRYHRPTAAGGE